MKRETILAQYRAWLTHREYSPATIQKYTHALARFFSDTGAGESPARETVAAWRDALSAQGYTPATVKRHAGRRQRLSGEHRQPAGQSPAAQKAVPPHWKSC